MFVLLRQYVMCLKTKGEANKMKDFVLNRNINKSKIKKLLKLQQLWYFYQHYIFQLNIAQ